MVERKPPGVSWESFVDRQIREAQQRGEFDDLPGAGRPLPDLHRPHDELWWIRRKMKDEGLSYLPPTLQVRRDVERAREEIAAAPSEARVREIVQQVNARIRRVNRTVLSGPASTVMPLDEEAVIRQWRVDRPGDDQGRAGR
jgi:hypothetical protein